MLLNYEGIRSAEPTSEVQLQAIPYNSTFLRVSDQLLGIGHVRKETP